MDSGGARPERLSLSTVPDAANCQLSVTVTVTVSVAGTVAVTVTVTVSVAVTVSEAVTVSVAVSVTRTVVVAALSHPPEIGSSAAESGGVASSGSSRKPTGSTTF